MFTWILAVVEDQKLLKLQIQPDSKSHYIMHPQILKYHVCKPTKHKILWRRSVRKKKN